MIPCSFCGCRAHIHAGPLHLCQACLHQTARTAPGSRAYPWYVSAVRRALFSDAPAQS
ncbi:MAG: hypothetical protein IJE08_12085 [Clostridia bacterium]|nr:hypothetical protein [Clostridia bacterium]